ncbi:hypothetical protein SAMN04489740_0514 [Arthrobacter alpinus]|uniref:Glycosyltransferase RgtA/B/C/D-like domain-containing protein n=1 Tax=Arthrobacter alpinus TaxID=656366 RepID=A0A1H5FI11_9MICC|nr:hypothetical protein SAMN04489740_0514 [Arthrobacter alpinus]
MIETSAAGSSASAENDGPSSTIGDGPETGNQPAANPGNASVAVAEKPTRQRYASLAFRWFGTTFSPGSPVRRIQHHGLAAAVAGIMAATVVLVRLLLPSTVGVADRGDGFMMMCRLGLSNVRPWSYQEFTQFIFPQWVPHSWVGEACPANSDSLYWFSSPHLLAWLGQLLTPVLGWGDGLDTRAIAVVSAAVFGLLLAGFVVACPGRLPFRLLAAAGMTAVVSDSSFAVFFVSPYPQAALFLGLFGLFVSLLFLWRRDTVTIPGLVGVAVAALCVFTADPQTVAILPALALALWWRPSRTRVGASTTLEATGKYRFIRRIAATMVIVVLTAGAALALGATAHKDREAQLYNAVFAEVLAYSPNPEGDLAWFGVGADFARYAGTSYGTADSGVNNPNFEQFTTEVANLKLAGFYLTHPERLVSLSERGVLALVRPQMNYLGHHTQESGQAEYSQDTRVSVVSKILWGLGSAPIAAFGLQLLVLVLGVAVALRRNVGLVAVALGRTSTIMVVAAWLLFWNVMFSQGEVDIYFRMLGPTFLTALCLPLLPMLVSILVAGRRP